MTALETDLTITCFGELRIELSGRVVTPELPGRQGRALFAYLVVAARPVSRDELIDVLWPASPPAHPDAAFGSVLAKVRRVLPAGLISGRGTLALQLPPDARVDVRDVTQAVVHAERALDDGDAEAALGAAQAAIGVLARPLLPSLSGAWVDAARAEVEDVQLRALETVARSGLSLGGASALAAAEHAAAALVERQPFREDRYALLMDAQARRGNSAEALRTFERLRVLLRDELGATPSPGVVAVHESVLRGQVSRAAFADATGSGNGSATRAPAAASFPVPAVAPRTSDGAFVGREECLEQLHGRWDESRAGRTGLILLVGDPGVGKTRLATRFAQDVHREGGAVLYGRADAEALLPYQPFAEALDHLIVHAGPEFSKDAERELAILARLFPSLGAHVRAVAAPVDQDALRYQVYEAVVSLLARASVAWPLLLVLDDLHWADKPTLLLLRHVLRHAEGTRLLVVGTFRDVDVPREHPLIDLLGDLRRERRYDRLRLQGLDEEATHALVLDRLGMPVTRGLVRRLQEQTDGNAFFIEETVRALEDSGVSPDAVVDEDALENLGVPEGVEEVIVRRVRQLSPLAAEILTAGSVVGRSFRLGIVEQLVDDGPDRVMAAVEESMAAGLILEVPDDVDVFTFSHALVRDVLYGQFTGTRRVRLHHRVAETLERMSEREPVNPAELAHHFELARHLAGPGPARRYSIAAGRRAAELFAYEEAAEHFRRALELFENDDDERGRCEALLALGRVEWHAGDDGARRTFMAAAKSAQRRGAADQLAGAALGLGERYFEVTYLGARYRDLLEKAIDAIGPEDSPQRALLLSRLAVNLAFPNEDDDAHELAENAVAIARRLADEKLLAAVLLARHVTLLDVRHIAKRLLLSRELGLLASGHRELAAERHHWRMYDLLCVGDLEGARREQAALEALAEALGQPLFRALALGGRGLWAELEGHVELSERFAEDSLRQARLAHTQDAVSSWASQLFALRRRQGRVAELGAFVERLAGSGGHQLGWLSALGVLRFETGDKEAARRIYEDELRDGPDKLPRGMFWLTRVALLSELCAKLGDVGGAEALYAVLAPHARWNVVVAYCSFWGPVDGYLALLARTAGDEARAADHARAALERTRAMNAPMLTQDLEALTGAVRANSSHDRGSTR
jgi:DNA-binding SARP family transcriptional activator/KaiC/GvpD/RAD55 family RecA-like ATPase